MADDKNMTDIVDSMLDDVFTDSDSFSDDNSDLFSLLGMSEEEIQAASDNLAKEDEEWKKKNAQMASTNSKERAKEEAADYIKRANESNHSVIEGMTSVDNSLDEVASFSDSDNETNLLKAHGAEKKQLKLLQKQQKKEKKLAKKQAKKQERLEKKQKKESLKQIIKETEEQETKGEEDVSDNISSFENDNGINMDELFAGSLDAEPDTDSMHEDIDSSVQLENKATEHGDNNVLENKQQSFGSKASRLLFGEEEDDYPTAEEIEKKEAKKKRKEEKKEEKRQKQAQKKEQHALDKSKAKEMAVIKKAAKKDKLEKIRQEEEEEDAKEKRIKGSSVFMVSSGLTILGLVVICGTSVFDYKMAIIRSSKYVEQQKYRLAYEQIVGVTVKEEDITLKDKIYCVMFVQQQLDSYYNFCKLGMYENGLDSLMKGLKKYNLHYEESVALGVSSELDNLKLQIETELQNQFGISADTASSWLELDQNMYSQTIKEHVSSLQLNTKQDSSGEKEITKNDMQ